MLRAVARLSLVTLLAAPAVVVLSASPCRACDCRVRTPEQLFRRADAAFVGSVTGQQAINEVTTVQTFSVLDVYKGVLGPTVAVTEPIGSGGGNTCGILYGGGRVAVILYRLGDGWTTDVCSRIAIAKLAGVAPTLPTRPSPPATATPVATGPPAGEGSGSLGWRTVIVGLLVGIAAIALALSLGGRRDRSRAGVPAPDEEAPSDDASDPPGPSG